MRTLRIPGLAFALFSIACATTSAGRAPVLPDPMADQACLAAEARVIPDSIGRGTWKGASPEQLKSCPEVGPDLIVRRWLARPSNRANLYGDAPSSIVLLDERIFSTMVEILGDTTRDRAVRVAATMVAVYESDSVSLPWFGAMYELGPGAPFVEYNPQSPLHLIPSVRGTRPIVGNAKTRLIDQLRMIVARERDDQYMRAIARTLLTQHFKIR